MRFTAPLALILLLTLPYFVWLGRPQFTLRRRTRYWISLAIRLLIAALIILSLAGAQVVRAADTLAVVFLLDASDSMATAERRKAETYMRRAVEQMGPDDQAAIVVFGADALVDRPMSGLAELAPITSAPQGLQTNLGEAIRLGMALFPAGSARRMVILSDGADTVGQALDAARLAQSAGIQIDVVPLPSRETETVTESWIEDVRAPSRVLRGEIFNVDVAIFSTTGMDATLRILGGGSIVHEAPVRLQPGDNNFSIPLQAAEQEFARFTVELVPANDQYYQNNRLAAFTEVVGPPRILLVSGVPGGEDGSAPDEAVPLVEALRSVGLAVERITAPELPGSLPQLNNFTTIVLVNVNARDLHPRTMEALQSYVRDLGGGLVAVGGPQSYGMGGYFRTPLEATLPLEMQIKDQDRFPSVSIAIVIDRSGSMSIQEGGLTKIQLANEAAVRVVELLNDFDEITVLPVDTIPSNVVGPVIASDKESIIGAIRQIGAGGGGINVRTGLEAAADAIAQSSNQVKHIIVLADGADSNEQEGVPQLIEGLVEEGVTITMVAIGDGKDVPWLQRMAELGQGRFHLTLEAANLPQIFTQETTSIQRSYLVEERFFPTLAGPSPILSGIRQTPPLYGYVGASPKATAQVILETHLGDPLLAAWQYGLGRSVAWTSDATGRWAIDWLNWNGFPTFWAQAVRWTIRQGADSNVEALVTLQNDEALLTVDVRQANGAFFNDLEMAANVVAPDGQVTQLRLEQTAPGRYQGFFQPQREGAYLLGISGSPRENGASPESGDELAVVQTGGWVLGYSPEYKRLQGDEALLRSIAGATGGRVIGGDPGLAFAHNLPSELTSRPIWPWLMLLATLLLPVDIAARRLMVTRRDVQRAWVALSGRVVPHVEPAERSTQIGRLFAAKERVADRHDRVATQAPAKEVETPKSAAPDKPQDAPQASPAARQQTEQMPEVQKEDDGDTLAARLRRRRQQHP
jgi:uncharacterized membrane protein/secreted protein with Ig-like and vWFA domain